MKAKRLCLNEQERNTLVNGLRVAAERFKAHCQELQDLQNSEPHRRLYKQFESQYSDSISLAEAIEDAESVILES